MGDWIPMEKIRNLSLKKTILFYFVLSLTAAFLLSAFTVHFARNMQNEIWEKYIDYADYGYIPTSDDKEEGSGKIRSKRR